MAGVPEILRDKKVVSLDLTGMIAGAKQINARVPLSEMFGYVNDLRSKTQGRGQYTMEPDGYEPVPKSISESIISERAKKD